MSSLASSPTALDMMNATTQQAASAMYVFSTVRWAIAGSSIPASAALKLGQNIHKKMVPE